MTIDWAPYKDDIIALHEQGLNLKAIQEAIAKQATLKGEDFRPSERSWRTKLQAWGCRTYQGKSSGRENMRSKQRRRKQNATNITFLPNADRESLTAELRDSHVSSGTSEHSASLTASSDTYLFPPWGGPFAYLEEDVALFEFEKHPLHAAVQMDSEDYIPTFLAKGCDINSRTQNHQRLTPLHVAIRRGRRRGYIQRLLSFGADVSLADGHGSVAFHWIIRWNPTAISALLGEGVEGEFGVVKAAKATKARDDNGHTFLHLALIGHRNGFLSAETLEATIPTYASRYPCLPYDARFPTGERPIDFLMGTMSHDHDFSCLVGREEWWRSMLSDSIRLPSLKFLSWVLPSEYAASEEVFFPGTRVGLLESLLKELPFEELPRNQVDDLVSLGISLLCHFEGPTELGELLSYFIEGECSKFWAQYPWGIEKVWKRTWIETSVKNRLIWPSRPLLCGKSNKSFLVRAVDEVELPPAQHEYHIAGFLARHNPRAAFYEEPDGRLPIVVAAERGLETVVETMFVAAKKDILADCDGQHSQIYDQSWPYLTELAKKSETAFFASNLWLTSVRKVFRTRNISSLAQTLLIQAGIRVFRTY